MRAVIAALAQLGDFDVYNLGGGLGVAYLEAQEPPRSRTTSPRLPARR